MCCTIIDVHVHGIHCIYVYIIHVMCCVLGLHKLYSLVLVHSAHTIGCLCMCSPYIILYIRSSSFYLHCTQSVTSSTVFLSACLVLSCGSVLVRPHMTSPPLSPSPAPCKAPIVVQSCLAPPPHHHRVPL